MKPRACSRTKTSPSRRASFPDCGMRSDRPSIQGRSRDLRPVHPFVRRNGSQHPVRPTPPPPQPFNPPRVVFQKSAVEPPQQVGADHVIQDQFPKELIQQQKLTPRDIDPKLQIAPASLARSDVSEAPKSTPPAPAPRHDSTLDERKRFINDWALENPFRSVAQARKALLDRFGTAGSTTYIASVLKSARDLHDGKVDGQKPVPKLEPVPRAPTPAPINTSPDGYTDVVTIVRALRKLGVRRLDISENSFRAEYVDS